MSINPDQFGKIAESLRQYRRAELLDFKSDMGNPIDQLYVDPLNSNAILKTVIQNNTTFLLGRKGTGKSTIFAKAQIELRKRKDVTSIYIDVKSLHELLSTSSPTIQTVDQELISEKIFQSHLLRKFFLAAVVADLVKELKRAYEAGSFIQKWTGKLRSYHDVIGDLEEIADDIKKAKLTQEEVPILKLITLKSREAKSKKESVTTKAKVNAKINIIPEVSSGLGAEDFDESIVDNEIYQEYSDAILRSFPFNDLLLKIRELLEGVGLNKLFVFFDDFSELGLIDQKLFVDVILSPLNNASNESIKLKVAGYPGRTYYGKIDPGKVDTIGLDFYQIYKSQDIQTSEANAIDYLERLLRARFNGFGENIEDYFDPVVSLSDYFRLLFEATLNVPRLIGYILHNCYLDKVSKNMPITASAIRLATQKYYESVLVQYFDRMGRYALEPFDRKLDRHNQKQLLNCIVEEARSVRRGINTGEIGGSYFKELKNAPVSHFGIDPSMESIFSALELNFLVTKYHEMRDKSGKDVSIFSLCYGLCESERFSWGYPKGRRDDRSYFVQRCFNYNSAIKDFLSKNQTIRCDSCGASFGMEKKETIEFYKWKCPDCQSGKCSVIVLSDDFKIEVDKLNKETMLPAVELEILETLNEEGELMRASEIALLVDTTYQMVGKRTSKLSETGLVSKEKIDGVSRSSITETARKRYFEDTKNP